MPSMQCPHCGQRYDLTDEQAPQYAGRTKINCSVCGKAFTVGGQPAMPAAPTAHYAPAYARAAKRSNGMAIASLVLGITGIVIPILLPSLLAVILGILTLKARSIGRWKRTGHRQNVHRCGNRADPAVHGVDPAPIAESGGNGDQYDAEQHASDGRALLLYANKNGSTYPPSWKS